MRVFSFLSVKVLPRRAACAALFACILALPPSALAGPIRAKSAILYDLDRRVVLYEQNADARVPPASLTKILSMYLVFDAVEDGRVSLRDNVKVSRRAALEGGSRMGLRPGDKLTLERLLYGMAVASGNDASCAVAEYVYGSQAAFVKKMNVIGKKLGMDDSTFKTPHGLPARGQYTTARDMLSLARNYIARFPKALRYHSARTVTIHNRTCENKNPQLGRYKGADGLKTGLGLQHHHDRPTGEDPAHRRAARRALGSGTRTGNRQAYERRFCPAQRENQNRGILSGSHSDHPLCLTLRRMLFLSGTFCV